MQWWHNLTARLGRIRLKKKQVLAMLAASIIILGAAFAAANAPPAQKAGETAAAPVEDAADADISADVPPSTAIEPAEGPTADPIPETPELESTDVAGNTIVPHNLPDDTHQAPAEQYTAHFARWEFACDHDACGGFPVEMDPVLLEKLEALRCALGRPVIITSGVRCEARNAEVGGIPDSRHLSGKAADLYCPGVHYTEVARVARAQGLWALEYPEEAYVHVEM